MPEQVQSMAVQCFIHKDEVVVTFSQPTQQWFMTAENARMFGKAFMDYANKIEPAKAMTRQ